MTDSPTFALVAGEASGDQLGSALIFELKKIWPDAVFVGVGGPGMRSAGMETWWDSEELTVFGLFEVLKHFPRLLRLRRQLRQRLLGLRPDVFIGIDAPDFNLGLEIQLRRTGIRTVHYVSPTVWAWRAKRVRKISRAADLVLCLFPFEPDFYRDHGVSAVYVGHPMADQIPEYSDQADARNALELQDSSPVIALLPGSRSGEVSRLCGDMLDAVSLIEKTYPEALFLAAIANQKTAEIFKQAMTDKDNFGVQLITGKPRTVIAAADVVICASGTATLETLLINRPMVVCYRVAPSTYRLAKTLGLVKLKNISLPNILAGEALVPELLQHDASGERMAQETNTWLNDKQASRELSERFSHMHTHLRREASKQAARAISVLMGRGNSP
jgi:lipid-A-disaccharide synthase